MYLTTIYIVSWARMDSLDFGTDFNCCHHHINHVFELLIFPNILFAKFKCLSLIATCYKHTRINIFSQFCIHDFTKVPRQTTHFPEGARSVKVGI